MARDDQHLTLLGALCIEPLTVRLKFNLINGHLPKLHRTKEINLSFASTFIGVTLFMGCRLQILGFAPGAELLTALLLTLLTGKTLFAQPERLIQQMGEGKLQAIDFDSLLGFISSCLFVRDLSPCAAQRSLDGLSRLSPTGNTAQKTHCGWHPG